MPAPRVVFTPEMDEALRRGSKQNLGIRPLADIVGVSRAVLRRRKEELGLPVTPRLGRPRRIQAA